MNVLVITQYFWPENFRINDLCLELSNRGHSVTILTGKPNYPDGEVFSEYKVDKSSYSEFGGCDIVRVPMFARGQASSIKLALNYISYAFSASFIGAFKIRKRAFDVIFVFEPSPITVGLPAVFLKKIKKVPIVFWVQDLWPETLEAVGIVKSKKALSFIGKLVSFIYNRCDMVLGQSNSFVSAINKYCDDAAKIKYFPNWSEAIFSDGNTTTFEEITKHSGFFNVLFAGNVGDAQDFPSLLDAMQLIKENKIKLKLFVVGDGRVFVSLQEEIKRRNLEDFIYLLGRYPLNDMPGFYASADALLVSLKDSSTFSMTIPSKIQSYMEAGKPILTMLSGEGSRIVEEAGCGLVSNSGDFQNLANNMTEMAGFSQDKLAEFGKNAKAYAQKEFNRERLIDQLEVWFEELVEKTKAKQ